MAAAMAAWGQHGIDGSSVCGRGDGSVVAAAAVAARGRRGKRGTKCGGSAAAVAATAAAAAWQQLGGSLAVAVAGAAALEAGVEAEWRMQRRHNDQ